MLDVFVRGYLMAQEEIRREARASLQREKRYEDAAHESQGGQLGLFLTSETTRVTRKVHS